MKVGLAICPNLNPSSPPLSLAYLASYLRAKSIEVVCMDFNIDLYSHANADNKSLWAPHMWQEWINKNKTPLADVDKGAVKRWVEVIQKESIQILGFSLLTTNVYTTMQVAKEIKKVCPDIKIVVGGPEVLRQLLLRHQDLWEVADVAVLGEGEEKLYQTITWLAGKNDAVMPVGVFTKEYTDMARSDEGPALPIDDLPYPDYSLFPLSSYKEKGQLPFIFSRGCIGRCAFCFEQKYWGKYRCRSVENVIGEMRHLKKEFNIWCFSLCDSLINGNMNFLANFCDRVIAENLQVEWWGMARVNSLMTEEFVRKMAKAGCQQIIYGIESGSQKILDLMGKGYSTNLIDKVIADTASAGVKPGINIMLGFPGEEKEEFEQTCKFVMRNAKFLAYVNISILGIEPGTDIYENSKKFGISGNDTSSWETWDHKNTLSVRMRRSQILQKIVDDYVGKSMNLAEN